MLVEGSTYDEPSPYSQFRIIKRISSPVLEKS